MGAKFLRPNLLEIVSEFQPIFPLIQGNFQHANPTLTLFQKISAHPPQIRQKIPENSMVPVGKGPINPQDGTWVELSGPPEGGSI